MSVKAVRRFPAVWALVLGALGAVNARAEAPTPPQASSSVSAPSNAQCARAYEDAQEQRKAGQLSAARKNLRLCASDECPDFIRSDCLTWHGEVQAELPTLVFSATSEGRDLFDVSIASGDRLLASRLEGQVMELDPGEYDLTVTAPGMRSKLLRVVAARGERNRLVRVELTPLASDTPLPPPAAAAALGTTSVGSALSPARAPSLVAPAVLTAVGVIGVGGFIGLGAWGHSSESKLAGTCAPRCDSERVAATHQKYVLADVSLGVGVATLAVATYLFLTAEAPRATGSRGVSVEATARDVKMTYGGRF